MKISYSLLLIVFVFLAPVMLNRVAADSEASVTEEKSNGNERVNGSVEPAKTSKDVRLDAKDSSKDSNLEGGESELKKVVESALTDDHKHKKGSESKFDKGANEGTIPVVKDKCDSSSNRCMDDDKTLVACLRVPGNDSPNLSLLIQNKGKDPLSVTISAPHLVLEKKQIRLREKEDTELKVSVKDMADGQFIILSGGHGNCRLDFRDQVVLGKKKGDGDSKSPFFNLFQQTSFAALLFLATLATAVASIFVCICWRRRLARKGPKYQMLDMELPVSHGSKVESDTNEGWDDNWEYNWDDEEAPNTPSFPVTPSFSSKGMATRKVNKEGWKD